MTSPSDWQRRLQELELDLDREARDRAQTHGTQTQSQQSASDAHFSDTPLTADTQAKLSSLYQRAQLWFQNLPTVGKAVVGLGAVVLGLSVLQTVVRLVTLAISLAILGVLGYFAYRLFFSGQQEQS